MPTVALSGFQSNTQVVDSTFQDFPFQITTISFVLYGEQSEKQHVLHVNWSLTKSMCSASQDAHSACTTPQGRAVTMDLAWHPLTCNVHSPKFNCSTQTELAAQIQLCPHCMDVKCKIVGKGYFELATCMENTCPIQWAYATYLVYACLFRIRMKR